MRTSTAAALVGAAILSTTIFPLAALRLRGKGAGLGLASPGHECAALGGRCGTAGRSRCAPATGRPPSCARASGKADITPRTGYYLGGWTRADRVAKGQHTRLFSRALVLERGGRKVALVSVDLFMVPGGMVQHIGEALASRGFSERNILDLGVAHPLGARRLRELPDASTPRRRACRPRTDPLVVRRACSTRRPADRQLYTLPRPSRSPSAIVRADARPGPRRGGLGLRRSSRASPATAASRPTSANHGIEARVRPGQRGRGPGRLRAHDRPERGRAARGQDRARWRGSAAPACACRSAAGRPSPTTARSPSPRSSTTTPTTTPRRCGCSRTSVRERGQGAPPPGGRQRLRQPQRGRHVGRARPHGPGGVGLRRPRRGRGDAARLEPRAAGGCAHARARHALDAHLLLRPGRPRAAAVADQPQVGLPFFTGSEEERGPLFDITGEHFEGRRSAGRRRAARATRSASRGRRRRAQGGAAAGRADRAAG